MREPPRDLGSQVQAAIREDVGTGDVTAGFVPQNQIAHGRVITREAGVMSGRPWVEEVFRQLDSGVRLRWHAEDGERIHPQQNLLDVEGSARSILTGERSALNFLQLLCAVATESRRYVDAVLGTGCTILDTRKTLPGLRTAQKYAVVCGGASNHRMGLFDMVLVKENHIFAAGSLTRAIESARRHVPGLKVEVEVETLKQLEEAIVAKPDIIMLDNFNQADMRKAVALNKERGNRAKLEASGNVSLDTVRAIAETGVDYISVGGLTKHVRALDLSMRLEFRSA
jgi:nicotinate-nucleotide pyrophosphorylase (carboxylating)